MPGVHRDLGVTGTAPPRVRSHRWAGTRGSGPGSLRSSSLCTQGAFFRSDWTTSGFCDPFSEPILWKDKGVGLLVVKQDLHSGIVGIVFRSAPARHGLKGMTLTSSAVISTWGISRRWPMALRAPWPLDPWPGANTSSSSNCFESKKTLRGAGEGSTPWGPATIRRKHSVCWALSDVTISFCHGTED